MKKSEELKGILSGIVNEIENDWNSKERESFTMTKFLELPWLEDGQFYIEDKKNKDELKNFYFKYDHSAFTSEKLGGGYFVIHEPFGSKSSPDYLFITPNGIFGIEDKSNNEEKIEWNTGSPGEDKIITFFHKSEKKVYLFTSWEYGWTKEIGDEYNQFKEQIREIASELFKKQFNKYGGAFNKLKFYARAQLQEGNNTINEIYDPEEINVKKVLEKFLDGEEVKPMPKFGKVVEYIQGKLF
jgi:hypothetical protein